MQADAATAKQMPTIPVKFMFGAAAATTGVPCFLPHEKLAPPGEKLLLKIYCCYFVCTADARSVSDS